LTDAHAGRVFEVRDIVPEKEHFSNCRSGGKANKNKGFSAFLREPGRVFDDRKIEGFARRV
jgi:hypothetical protein